MGNGYVQNIQEGFIDFKGEKSYLTGDMGYIKNNEIYFIQRTDKQLKHKGYRIELLDIENNINKLKYVEKSIVIANDNTDIIYAFVKINEEKNIREIKEDLLKNIPKYMIPIIKIIKEIPLNKNGKCDEKKLMEEYLQWKKK